MEQRTKQVLIHTNPDEINDWRRFIIFIYLKKKCYRENQENGKEFEEDLLDPGSDDSKIVLKLIWSMKISRRPLCLFDSSAKYQKQLERENFSSWQENQ